MISYYKENIQFYLILIIWLITGVYGGALIFLVLPITLLLLKRTGSDLDLLIGFWFILILSDNLTYSWQFAKTVKDIYIVILSGLFFLDMKSYVPLNGLFKKFIPFFIIAAIAILNSDTYVVSIQKAISYMLLFLVVPNYFIKAYRDEGDLVFKKIIYFIITIMIICLLLMFFDGENALSHGGRLRGMFGNPNGLGLFAMLSFLLTYLIIHFKPNLFSLKESRLVYLIIIIPLVLCGSRNVATALVLFLILGSFYKSSPFIGFIIFLVFILLYEIIGTNYIQIIKGLGLESFFRLNTIEVGGGRYFAWQFAWQQIQYNFFIGKGFGFDEFIMRKNYDMLLRLGHQGGVHNTYLILWLNTGLIGIACYFYSFILVFIKGAKKTRLAFPIMFAVMFTINFEPWLASSLNPLTIVLLFVITMLIDDSFSFEKKTIETENE